MGAATLQEAVALPVNEKCDLDCPAPAVVAVVWPTDKSSGRLVFCGHHYDLISPIWKAKFTVVKDTRKVNV